MRPVAAIGVMPMPEDFKYAGVFRKGKPQHDFYDTFRIRHPKMAAGKRAKIFAPFDALTGFSEAICAKDIEYTDRIEPDEAHLAEGDVQRLTGDEPERPAGQAEPGHGGRDLLCALRG